MRSISMYIWRKLVYALFAPPESQKFREDVIAVNPMQDVITGLER